MKFILFLTFFSFTANQVFAQSRGLVAHWNFDSTTNDVSGNGHHGRGANLSAAAGRDGIAGHGYYFNGSNSVVTVPYNSAFNLTQFSICATIKVSGYYMGECGTNTIFTRGPVATNEGIYAIYFFDQPNSGGCSRRDTSGNVVAVNGGYNVAASISSFNYTPRIRSNVWYKLVVTFDSLRWKLFVDGVQKYSIPVSGTVRPIGPTTDSISIGMDVFQASRGYPYNFNGVIDDIMLYNRALSDSEAMHYGDTCGQIVANPINRMVSSGVTTTFTTASSIVGARYQWQADGGLGFVNLTNSGPYSGVTSATLTVVTSTVLNNNHYRCLVTSSSGCEDTSSSALLMINTGLTSTVAASYPELRIVPNPTNKSFQLMSTQALGIGTITISDLHGSVVKALYNVEVSENIEVRDLASGFYLISVVLPQGTSHVKLLKE